MTSHAEKYAASRMRHQESKSVLAGFRRTKDFELDHFQIDACKALESGRGVLVAAPTGAGKTIVGEFAIYLALHQKGKAFYTTPIKALSNQKFNELVDTYGEERVGLLTGDVSINSEADIIVMTTEVLRNMLYVQSQTLVGLRHVIMDEVHYLADRSRGAVWEEVILHLPESVQVTALSATVSNAEEFGDWLSDVRGDTAVIVEEHRPVPLWQLVAADSRLHDLFIDEEQRRLNPELLRIHRDENRFTKGKGSSRGGRSFSPHTPSREELIKQLRRAELLPAIYFIFSRKGCDQAVEHCLRSGLNLTTPEERAQIASYVDDNIGDLPGEDLAALDFGSWLHALERGISAHHAGLIPRFKEIVETLFQAGLLKVVFATETLALGINMPAKSVVIDKLSKWNGDAHVNLSPGEFTQLTGRAGRRGIDDEGNAIVVWQKDLDPAALAGLASTRTYPLRSSFRPGYTMACNVLDSLGYERTIGLLGSSFAQFQADRGVAGLTQQIRKFSEGLRGYKEAMTCHLGDFFEYASLRNQLAEVEKEAVRNGRLQLRREIVSSIESLEKGDIIMVTTGRRAGPAVVLNNGVDALGEPRPLVLTMTKEVRKLNVTDFEGEILPLDRLRIPRNFDARSAKSRNDLVNALRRSAFSAAPQRRPKTQRSANVEAEISRIRSALKAHPCHGCADREGHARWSERYFKAVRERDGLQKQVDHRTNVITKDFERVCSVLSELGYIQGEIPHLEVTEYGAMLKRIHSESELMVCESLRRGIFEGLSAAELVAVVSVLVYESRRDDEHEVPRTPSLAVDEAVSNIFELWAELSGLEAKHKLSNVRKPDAAFAFPIYKWAQGARLSGVLRDSDLSAGDFVRATRRLIDLLEQIAAVSRDDLQEAASEAIDLVRRGIVAAVEGEDQ